MPEAGDCSVRPLNFGLYGVEHRILKIASEVGPLWRTGRYRRIGVWGAPFKPTLRDVSILGDLIDLPVRPFLPKLFTNYFLIVTGFVCFVFYLR